MSIKNKINGIHGSRIRNKASFDDYVRYFYFDLTLFVSFLALSNPLFLKFLEAHSSITTIGMVVFGFFMVKDFVLLCKRCVED